MLALFKACRASGPRALGTASRVTLSASAPLLLFNGFPCRSELMLTPSTRPTPPPQRGEANTVEARSVLRVKARSLGSKDPAARETEGEKGNAPRTAARSAWAKVRNALRAFTGEKLFEEDGGIVNQENEKGR